MLGVLLPRRMDELEILSDVAASAFIVISALTFGAMFVFAVMALHDYYNRKND